MNLTVNFIKRLKKILPPIKATGALFYLLIDPEHSHYALVNEHGGFLEGFNDEEKEFYTIPASLNYSEVEWLLNMHDSELGNVNVLITKNEEGYSFTSHTQDELKIEKTGATNPMYTLRNLLSHFSHSVYNATLPPVKIGLLRKMMSHYNDTDVVCLSHIGGSDLENPSTDVVMCSKIGNSIKINNTGKVNAVKERSQSFVLPIRLGNNRSDHDDAQDVRDKFFKAGGLPNSVVAGADPVSTLSAGDYDYGNDNSTTSESAGS